MPFRSGFVCILGRPNAGKSTLLNALVGEKLAIISPKPQTTRNRILGILHIKKQKGRTAGQVILIDTPGVHRPDSSLGRKMMSEVREALEGFNFILLLVDAAHRRDANDEFILDFAKKSGTPIFLILNKIDLLRGKKQELLPLIQEFSKLHDFHAVLPISARKRDGLDLLSQKLIESLPEGPRYFPEDQVTDQPMRIAATIYCERDGQKAILIGKRGQMLKRIGTAARLQIEKMIGTRVFLELFVKVQPGWRESRDFVEDLDWRRQLERLAGTGKP
jgi:GTP-binding protein Era